MELIEQFKSGMKKSWLNGRSVGAYSNINGLWAAISTTGEVDVFDTKKEASKWLKNQYRALPEDTVH